MKMVLWLSVTSLLLSSLTMELHSLQVQPTDHTTDGDVRLVGGTSHCAGKLELKNEGEWRRVYPTYWTIKISSVVCRQLDCGTVVSTKWSTGSRSERLWWILSAKCDGSESSIRECGSMNSQSDKTTLELVCSESVRLVNGTSSCSGRVEVKSKQSWVSVCEGYFDHHNAEVVCKELGCGTPSVLQGALYGEVMAPMLTKEFHCEGNESALLDCRTSDSTRNTCSSDKTVGLTCSEPDVRLVGGTSHCDGTVEIKHEGEWRLADMNWWNLKSASVVCKQLDCGSAASIKMSSGSQQAVWRICSSCVGSESSLTECGTRKSMLWSYKRLEVICSDSTKNSCSPGETIGHSCSEPEDIRLVGGTSNCTGTLEMKGRWGQWSPVDDYYGWKLESAMVVCRQLNCGSAVSTQRSLVSGYKIIPAWVVSTCDGSESSLRECGTRMSTSDTTNHRLEVICSALHVQPARYTTESTDLRLVGGSRHCTGMVEVKHEDEWNPLNPYAWSQKLSSVACRQLDCGNAVSERFSSGSYKEPAWRHMTDRSCVGSESSLTECGRWDDYYSEERMELTCSGSVRLVKGPSSCSGRVEVKSNQSWVSVCEGDFDQQDAEVVCRQLDCGAPSVLQAGLYRPWYATMSTKDFQCEGNESALQDCRTSDSTRNTCSPDKTVGLTCSEPDLRLSGGTSHCAGIIEMKFNGEWRPTDTFHWNLKQASVVCRQLDCGSAISTKKRTSLKQPVWYTGYECVGSESSLKECKGSYYSHNSPDNNVEVICSEAVRLVNGTSSCLGRVEVKSDQSWVSVCEGDFDQQDAEVLCRELGCGAPSVLQAALYGEAKAPMSTKKFQCEGSESTLLDCRASESTRNTCSPDKTVGLTCSAPEDIRLGGGTSRCDGIFEMQYQGEWRPVDEHRWDRRTAALVCRQLNCGTVVSTEETHKYQQPVWALRSSCGSSDSSLRDCILKYDSTSIEVIALTCSGATLH